MVSAADPAARTSHSSGPSHSACRPSADAERQAARGSESPRIVDALSMSPSRQRKMWRDRAPECRTGPCWSFRSVIETAPLGIDENCPGHFHRDVAARHRRSEEHTSELQSLMRISYAVFCLKKKKKH